MLIANANVILERSLRGNEGHIGVNESVLTMDLIPKWRPINYTFVCMLLALLAPFSLQNSFVFYTC